MGKPWVDVGPEAEAERAAEWDLYTRGRAALERLRSLGIQGADLPAVAAAAADALEKLRDLQASGKVMIVVE